MHSSSPILQSAAHRIYRALLRVLACLMFATALPAQAQNWAVLVDGSSCTLQKAIAFANKGNGVDGASVGSKTTDYSGCFILASPFIYTPLPGSYGLYIQPPKITVSSTDIDNHWYGANAFPPIASDITLYYPTNGWRLVATHTGDPTPTTANAFRFFYVSGGLHDGLPAGHLTIYHASLENGYAKGGNSGGFDAGGGAGMGGAIFNQGTLTLIGVSLIRNTAHGGNQGGAANGGGGGMGQDAVDQGGGMGDTTTMLANFGGAGAITDGCRGGGGGGFKVGANGSSGSTNSGTGGTGGGLGKLGGAGGSNTSSGGNAGDGGGGGGGVASSPTPCPAPPPGQDGRGGNFGSGGKVGGFPVASVAFGAGGGGGVGGGGASGEYGNAPGGGGGFGGGGGSAFGNGAHSGTGGFGGGNYGFGGGAGGAGMGGAIFNHRGSVSLLNVTANGNVAAGGARYFDGGVADGGGLGAVLFNLNGTVTIDFSTLAGNTLSGTNANDDAHGMSDGTVYSVAYGSKIEDGSASSATLTINNSVIHGTHADAGNANDDLVVSVVGGNTSSYQLLGKNLIGGTHATGGVTLTQPSNDPVTADPLLGALSIYYSATYFMPVLPVGESSPTAFSADINGHCLQANGVTALGTDARDTARPYNNMCNAGAYQFNGNYIFASGFEPKP